jgi:AraC-like DNA-binding protein
MRVFGIDAERDPRLPERVPHSFAVRALQSLIDRTGDAGIGLRAAQRAEPGQLDVIEYVARSSTDVGQALDDIGRYSRLLHDAAVFERGERDGLAVFRYGVDPDLHWPPALAEFLLTLLTLALRSMTGGRCVPALIWFAHPEPPHAAACRELLGCPVKFGAPHDALLFSPEMLALPLAGADAGLRAVLQRQAEQLVKQVPLQDRFRDKVREEIDRALRAGETRVNVVARHLGVSPRTLRRRLQGEGTGYAELLDDARRELALAELRAQHRSIAEIATLLGFSRIPSFYRAFRRWTGTTPAGYRAQDVAGAKS